MCYQYRLPAVVTIGQPPPPMGGARLLAVGLNLKYAHPDWMILQVLPIPPPPVKPSDRPRPLPFTDEMKNATNITERKPSLSWDYDLKRLAGEIKTVEYLKLKRRSVMLNIKEKTDIVLSWPSEEAPPVIKGSLDANEDTTLSLPSEEVSLVVEGPLEASKDIILSSALNVAPLEVVFAGPGVEESTSGKTIADESVRIEQNELVDFNEGKSPNLVMAANDVGNNGFSPMDHQWQCDLFATSGAAQVDTWNHNRPQPVNTFKWRSGSVRCNLGEPNILETYGNDMGITNYGLILKDEAIKKLKERTQISKKRLKI
nr:hypothetical protein [Tanacetum cinerariifolium]